MKETARQRAHDFVGDMIEHDVLAFGDFELKSGRRSPYFFNLGNIDDGSGLERLGQAYAECTKALGIEFDLVFGPAYKGIPIAVATAIALSRLGVDAEVAYNRKEAKAHGEGGSVVGAPVEGKRVLVVDDVMTAGTAIGEAARLIAGAGGTVAAIIVALDRQELADDGQTTAVEAVSRELAVPVISIANLDDVIGYVEGDGRFAGARGVMADYRSRYCRESDR